MSSPKEILKKWIDALNDRDIDTLIDYYHPEAINDRVAAESPLEGWYSIKADFISFFTAFPNSYAKIENLMEHGE